MRSGIFSLKQVLKVYVYVFNKGALCLPLVVNEKLVIFVRAAIFFLTLFSFIVFVYFYA